MFGKSRNFELENTIGQLVHRVSDIRDRLDALERSQQTTHQYIKEIYRLLKKEAAISEKFDESVS